MRRSKAPSVLNKAKRVCNSKESEGKGHCSDPEVEEYAWGSRNVNFKRKSRYENKRIFNVVWRDVSTKKHKTWQGDGTLEVSNDFQKATLKDQAGKYMGSSTKFNRNDLVPDFFMIIGGKEIEIQNEITEDQLYELRKRQVENRVEDWISSEDKNKEEKKPKGGFKFKPILVLNPPKITSNVKNFKNEYINLNSDWITEEIPKSTLHSQTNISNNESALCSSNLTTPDLQTYLNDGLCKEYICFLKPSELQQFLFKKVLEWISSTKSSLTLEKIQSFSIEHVLQNICNHPSLINHNTTTNKLVRYLIPALPDWTEMGPFDSSKLEFVQYYLTDLKKLTSQVCAILAKNLNVLNMLQGLCDFMDIKCLRLEDIEKQDIIEFCNSEKDLTRVLLVNSEKMLNNFDLFIYCKKVIIFEDVSKNLNITYLDNATDITIYSLVTAFSIEELLLLDTFNNDNMENILGELVNITNMENDCCYLHSKIKCNCFKSTNGDKNLNNIFKNNWDHFKCPFDAELLKISSLENSSENIVSIFCKKNHVKIKNK